MKKVFFMVLLTIFAVSIYSHGQTLEPQMGLNGKWGFVNEYGNPVIPFRYDIADGFIEGVAAVKLNGKWGFIDKTDNVVIPFNYDWADAFFEGLSMVCFNGKWGFIDKTGEVVIPLKYDHVLGFSHELPGSLHGFLGPSKGLSLVCINGKYGFIDKTGTEVVPVRYTKEKAIRKFKTRV